jgi:chromosome segregation ATPase
MQIEELEETRQQKEAEVQTVQAQIQKAEDQLHQLHQQIDQATQQLDQLQGESQDKAEQLATLEGIKAFLLGRLSADDPLWEKLEHLIQMKRRGELPSEHTQQMMTGHLMMKFTEFLSQVEAEGRRAS